MPCDDDRDDALDYWPHEPEMDAWDEYEPVQPDANDDDLDTYPWDGDYENDVQV